MPATLDEIKARLRAEFQPRGWSIITTKPSGKWCATRGPAPGEQVQDGVSFITADTPEELAGKLRKVENAEREAYS